MKNSNNSKFNAMEMMAWVAMFLITLLSVFVTYYYNFSYSIKIIVWIGWLFCIAGFGYFTTIGKNIYSFADEAKQELQKVVWPSRQETIQTTSIVMVMVTITGFILWGTDSGMMWIIAKITHLG